jgi:16S rRNA processing protein RimM
MAYKNDILLGRITKVSGYEGAVTVKLERFLSGKLPNMESVFLEIEGRPVPFFISDSDYSGADILKLRFEGYNSYDKVIEFVGCRVFLTTPVSVDTKTEELKSLIGYSVLTPDNILLGSIEEVIPNPGQWLLSIISPLNKEILIPLHEHFIVKIDNKRKLLIMDLPAGLAEIN